MIDYLASMTVGEILPVLANRATAFSTSWTAWHWGCTCKHDTVILLRYKKNIWSFTAKQDGKILLNNWNQWGLDLNWVKSKFIDCKIVQHNPNFRKPRDSKLIWKNVIYSFFKPKYHIRFLNVGPTFAAKTALTYLGMDSIRPDSSDQATFFHRSLVQFWCSIGHHGHFWRVTRVSMG